MEIQAFAKQVRRMREAQKARDTRRTAVAEARCEPYQEIVDELVDEILGPPLEFVRQDQCSGACGGHPLGTADQGLLHPPTSPVPHAQLVGRATRAESVPSESSEESAATDSVPTPPFVLGSNGKRTRPVPESAQGL